MFWINMHFLICLITTVVLTAYAVLFQYLSESNEQHKFAVNLILKQLGLWQSSVFLLYIMQEFLHPCNTTVCSKSNLDFYFVHGQIDFLISQRTIHLDFPSVWTMNFLPFVNSFHMNYSPPVFYYAFCKVLMNIYTWIW